MAITVVIIMATGVATEVVITLVIGTIRAAAAVIVMMVTMNVAAGVAIRHVTTAMSVLVMILNRAMCRRAAKGAAAPPDRCGDIMRPGLASSGLSVVSLPPLCSAALQPIGRRRPIVAALRRRGLNHATPGPLANLVADRPGASAGVASKGAEAGRGRSTGRRIGRNHRSLLQ